MRGQVTTQGRLSFISLHAPWPLVLSRILALVGLLIAIYLSAVHVSSNVTLYCTQTAIVNCERVITSPSSIIFGIPVAFYGVFWFAGMLTLLFLPPTAITAKVRLVWVIGGIGTVLYLLGTELLIIGVICLWCTAVHIIVFFLFALTVLFPTALQYTLEQDRRHDVP